MGVVLRLLLTRVSGVLSSCCQHLGIAILLSLIVAASSTPALAGCNDGAMDRLVVELLFGRNSGNRLGVSEQAFQRFVDREITSRFPDGFTLIDTRGQFRNSGSRSIVSEPGKYLLIALGDEVRDLPRIREIIDAYKSMFKQQSVGMIAHRSCVSF